MFGYFPKFVLSGNEESLSKFYSAKTHAPILGGEDFINWLKEGGFSFSGEHVGYETGILRPPIFSVEVAKFYMVSEEGLFRGQRGKMSEKNIFRPSRPRTIT